MRKHVFFSLVLVLPCMQAFSQPLIPDVSFGINGVATIDLGGYGVQLLQPS